MPGEAGSGRTDRDIEDGAAGFKNLIACLAASDLSYEIDAPSDPKGEWWLDLSFDGFATNVAWQADRGFGIYTSDDEAYGAGPDEVFRDAPLAAKRLGQLAKRASGDRSAMRLSEVRALRDQPQTAIAEKLNKDQSIISRLENQNDAHLSTIRDYVEALGGEMRVMVRFSEFDALVDLPATRPERKRKRRDQPA